MEQPGHFYCLFLVFSNKHHYKFHNKCKWKMSIQYTVPGFEPTTFRKRVSSHNHYLDQGSCPKIKLFSSEKTFQKHQQGMIKLFEWFKSIDTTNSLDGIILPENSSLTTETTLLKAQSHYCIFNVHLWQTVALLRRDRKIPISALTQSTAESADRCGECEWAFR